MISLYKYLLFVYKSGKCIIDSSKVDSINYINNLNELSFIDTLTKYQLKCELKLDDILYITSITSRYNIIYTDYIIELNYSTCLNCGIII